VWKAIKDGEDVKLESGYSGNGNCRIGVDIYDSRTRRLKDIDVSPITVWASTSSVAFSKGSATMSWSGGKEVDITGGGVPGSGETVTYTGTSGGATYTLKITESAAKYVAQTGDTYELKAGSKTSTGTVIDVSGGVLTLKPSNSSTTFTLTVSGGGITAIDGTITWTDGTTETAPGTLGGGTSDLPGNITISPASGVTTGTVLTATYSGSETVSYQWKKDGGNVGTNSKTYTPAQAGSYTVTVSAAGYNSKTSAAVSVTASQGQQLSVSIQFQGIRQIGSTLTAVVITNLTGAVSYQWLRYGNDINGATSSSYTVTAQDLGEPISVKVTVNGQTVTSAMVYPIEFVNASMVSNEDLADIKQEIQEAYDNNLNGCKTAINSYNGPWCVEITNNTRVAKVIGGKLYIYFSLGYYDSLSSDKTTRLGQIGLELQELRDNAIHIS
jgi:hypothetical protein